MLYIFYVDVGKRLTFDMSLVNESVKHLKDVIEEVCNIAATKQVLLISGGDCLEDSVRVCMYSAGTDTNPIFLFNRNFLERSELPYLLPDFRFNSSVATLKPVPPIDVVKGKAAFWSKFADAELNQLYDTIENLSTPATIYTMTKINHLAQKYFDQATEMKVYCDQLNIDQLLQQQGWSAAIANLDDVLVHFKSQYETFDVAYTKYLETRDENIELLNRFSEDLELLSKIPLLPALLDGNEEERARLDIDYEETTDVSLLRWISAKEPEQSLENVVLICKAALEKYDEYAIESLKKDIANMFHPERVRELHGTTDITEKLMTLSGLIETIKDTYEDQAKKASGIRRNHERAADLKDDSILPDLVATHRDTLKSMRANHTNLRSCRQLCIQSKKELCDIIHKRLKAVMVIQERAAEIRSMLVLHGANMKRVKDYFDLVQQLHTTPSNYFAAVSEVVRRRSYSQAFLMWASDLACRIFSIYTEEVERRKKFLAQFEGHFLNCLFPGLEDMPPKFATQSPPLFDNLLPALSEDDLKQLCDSMPDFEEFVQLPDVESIRNFFLTKSLTLSEVQDGTVDDQTDDDKDKMAVVMSTSGRQMELVSSKMEQGSPDDSQQDENGQINQKHEVELRTMREGMAVLGTVAHSTVISLRNDLLTLRNWVGTNQMEIVNVIGKLYSQTRQQESHICNLTQMLAEKDDEINVLRTNIAEIKNDAALRSKDEELERRIREVVEKEKEQAVKEVTERLTRDHKREIDSLRQRFRLMTCTTMERSPSDSSLEKIERGEVIELVNHEAIMEQLKLDLETRMNNALADEKLAWEKRMQEELTKNNLSFDAEKQLLIEATRKPLLEELNKQIEITRLKESTLISELHKYKDTLRTLSGPDGGTTLLNRIEELEQEKSRLASELIKERTSKYAFGQLQQGSSGGSNMSCISYPTDSGGSSSSLASSGSPELISRTRHKERIYFKKSRVGNGIQGKVCLRTCNVGDAVLVVWDDVQSNYTILQESSTLYFLHPTSIETLGLRPPSDGTPRRLYCPAEVVEKEYCAPKRTVNRYNLREGERFYRVKVKPLGSLLRTA